MKSCLRCKQMLSLDNFYPRTTKSGNIVYYSYCKPCNRKKADLWKKENRSAFDKIQKAYKLRWKYDITVDEYAAMLKAQSNSCKICGCSFETTEPCVDHCHTSSKIRGILCHHCNRALGLFKDDTVRIQKALEYLS